MVSWEHHILGRGDSRNSGGRSLSDLIGDFGFVVSYEVNSPERNI